MDGKGLQVHFYSGYVVVTAFDSLMFNSACFPVAGTMDRPPINVFVYLFLISLAMRESILMDKRQTQTR